MKRQFLHAWLIMVLLVSGCTTTDKPRLQTPQQQGWSAWHQQWVGTHYLFGGNDLRGIDCSAYVQRGFRELYGIELPRTVKTQGRLGYPVSFADLQMGDLVFFRPDTYPHHVGVYLGKCHSTLIH